MLQILDEKVQLHQEIRIIYVVDGYEAIFSTTDGQKEIACAKGETIFDALQNLEPLIKDFDIRKR